MKAVIKPTVARCTATAIPTVNENRSCLPSTTLASEFHTSQLQESGRTAVEGE